MPVVQFPRTVQAEPDGKSLGRQEAAPVLIQESAVRLDAVRRISHNFGYGVGDDMDYLLAG